MAGVKPLELVHRFTDILAAINQQPGLNITDLARATKISRGAVNRFVIAIEEMGFIRRDDRTKGYWPTSKTYELSSGLFQRSKLRASVIPYLADVCRQVGWTVNFSTITNSQLALVAHTDDISPLAGKPRQPDLFRPLVGRAAGHVLLAAQNNEVLSDILTVAFSDNPHLYSDAGITLEQMPDILESVKRQGYAAWTVSSVKRTSIAVLVPSTEPASYSISVGFDSDTISIDDAVSHCLSALKTCAQKISRNLPRGLQDGDQDRDARRPAPLKRDAGRGMT